MIKYKINEDDFNLLANILDKRSQAYLLPKIVSREILISEKNIDILCTTLLNEFIDKGTKSSDYEPTEYGERVENLMDKINAMRLKPVTDSKNYDDKIIKG
jgi:hypothetical protein